MAHKDEVYTELRVLDFICLTVTWLTTFASDKLLVLDGYMMLRQDRMQKNKKGKMKNGGGILLYYKTQYRSFIELIPELCNNTPESEEMWLKVTVPGCKKFFLAIIY